MRRFPSLLLAFLSANVSFLFRSSCVPVCLSLPAFVLVTSVFRVLAVCFLSFLYCAVEGVALVWFGFVYIALH